MKSFDEYLSTTTRKDIYKLKSLGTIFKRAGFDVKSRLKNTSGPFLFIKKPAWEELEGLSFQGIRLYVIGRDTVCYRIQNSTKKQPFGTSYELRVKEIYRSLLREYSEEKIAYITAYYLVQELVRFFQDSMSAEIYNTDRTRSGKENFGSVAWRSSNMDYSSFITGGTNAGRIGLFDSGAKM